MDESESDTAEPVVPHGVRIKALYEWVDTHIKNSVVSQNTTAYNAVEAAVRSIVSALNTVKE